MTTRAARPITAIVVTALLCVPHVAAAQTDPAAQLQTVLDQTRAALGGSALTSLRTLSAEGEVRRVFGEREMTGDLEIKLAGSSQYLWSESMARGGDPSARFTRTVGLNGDKTIESMPNMMRMMNQASRPDAGGTPPPAPDPAQVAERQQRQLRAQQRQLSRLLLAMLLRTEGPVPLQLAYAGDIATPDGTADVITATGADGFSAQLFIDRATHLPVLLAYKELQRVMGRGEPGRRPGTAAADGQAAAPAPSADEIARQRREAMERARNTPPTVVDVQWFLSNYKKVNGVLLPHTVRRSENGTVREEWTFSKFSVNPTFKAGTFDTP